LGGTGEKMKNLRLFLFLIFFVAAKSIFANGGPVFIDGNTLVPIIETDIELRKEVLRIERLDWRKLKITVDYELFNPGKEKTILVGFEHQTPELLAGGQVWKERPLVDFKVNINDENIKYKVISVPSKDYYKNGLFLEIKEDEKNVSSIALYYFEADFKKGTNRIRHEYFAEINTTGDYFYWIPYLLTPANRWANKQIDDFTMILDLGDFQEFGIENEQFIDSLWQYDCKSTKKIEENYDDSLSSLQFFTKTEPIVYHQKKFYPTNELFIFSNWPSLMGCDLFDYQESKLTYQDLSFIKNYDDILAHDFGYKNEVSYNILSEFLYALRGKRFSNPVIQAYYDSLEWYQPDPNYDESKVVLNDKEKQWMEQVDEVWKKQEKK
jgi:YARHG domain